MIMRHEAYDQRHEAYYQRHEEYDHEVLGILS